MAQQHAVLIGGTGYQYGDSDFLEYSERVYLDLAKRLHEGPTAGPAPVAVGTALVKAKQDYLGGSRARSAASTRRHARGHDVRPADDGVRGPGPAAIDAGDRTQISTAVHRGDARLDVGCTTDDSRFDTPTTRHQGLRGRPSDRPRPTFRRQRTWLDR